MIGRICGQLIGVEGNTALLRLGQAGGEGHLVYEVMLPAYAAQRLAETPAASETTFHTLHFVESQSQGALLLPRLAGFQTQAERAFFELFTTVKGIGHRKALRAMALEMGQIAAAIADRDVATLQTLPEVGRRTAETIIATLRDKVDRFISADIYGDPDRPATKGTKTRPASPGLAREALEALLTLGEDRARATQWIDKAMMGDDPPRDVEALLQKVFAMKSGA